MELDLSCIPDKKCFGKAKKEIIISLLAGQLRFHREKPFELGLERRLVFLSQRRWGGDTKAEDIA